MILSNNGISINLFVNNFEITSSLIKRKKDLYGNFFITRNLALAFLLLALPAVCFRENNFYKPGDYSIINFTIAALLAAVVSYLSIKLKFLTYSGSLAAFIIAVPVFGFGGIKWSLPLLTFFILSSIFSKYRENKNPGLKELVSKSGRRDHFQVLANGGTAGFLIIINQFFLNEPELIYAAFVSSLAAACSDTWGTEAGTFFKKKTVNILNFREVNPGFSGGVSIPGTIGAVSGSLVIALSSLFWIEENIFNYTLLVASAGIFGSTADSIIGASLQRKYICTICGRFTERTEHCGKAARLYSGIEWISNDTVNFFCSVSGALFLLILKIL